MIPNKGRNYEFTAIESDDDLSSYMEAPTVYRTRGRSKSKVRVTDEVYSGLPSPRQPKYYQYAYDTSSQYDPRDDPNIIINNQLGVPTTRYRAASTGAPPQPNQISVVIPPIERDSSKTRIKYYRKEKYDSDSYSSDDSDRKSSRKNRRSRSKRRGSGRDAEYIDPIIAQQLAELKLLREGEKRKAEQEEQKKFREYVIAEERKRLEEQGRKQSLPPDVAARLEKFNQIEERRSREDAEAALMLKMKEDERKRKEREEKIMSEYQEQIRQRQAAEKEALTRAEAKVKEEEQKKKEREDRLMYEYKEAARKRQEAESEAIKRAEDARAKKEAEAKLERERLLADEREKAKQAAIKEKAERERILAETKAKADEEKAETERMIAAYKLKMEKEKKAQDAERLKILAEEKAKIEKAKQDYEDERKRILAAEEERKKKEKADYEEMRDRVLATEKKKEDEAKAKKKAEDDAFKARVKEQFKEAGFSQDYIENILERKKEKNTMALEAARPTYIRVQIRYLLPETLEYYHLPWEYDAHDDRYLLIKEYISHELQQELFQHTKRILKQRDTRLITDGYTKETVTTLKPNIYKDKDKNEMFLVRRKSTGKSPSRPSRNSWMFS